ncbi:uncharacterized protein CLUP02_12074 [Colletotrichum lupini]|uniref:Uncharacterized protein n=1 Tax=Colletotrichum lupini TaxID=145971 RepID=A0A9Q8WKX0_9PEZI|nr:uncharacterized protein CLUP02_12074 [Colletotrichum lupini]UQC86572.1 hypothetical protein CLUP02_12074 [Colletotrichum lupini]
MALEMGRYGETAQIQYPGWTVERWVARPGLPSNDCKKHGVEKPPDKLVASASHNVFATRTVVLAKVDIWGPGRAVSGMAEAIRTPGSSSEALRNGELQQRGTYRV